MLWQKCALFVVGLIGLLPLCLWPSRARMSLWQVALAWALPLGTFLIITCAGAVLLITELMLWLVRSK